MAELSRRVHLLVEGQTEETVVDQVVRPYLQSRGKWVTSSILVTSRPVGRSWHHGGVTSWTQMARDMRLLLADSSIGLLTTLVDYYAVPDDVPGMDTRPGSGPRERVEHVEAAMAEAIADPRFVPHLTLHEFEAWVFAAGDHLADLAGDKSLKDALAAEVRHAGGPEFIDDGPLTAPSKRLMRLYPEYTKTFDGPMALADLGVDGVRRVCPHADAWFRRLGV